MLASCSMNRYGHLEIDAVNGRIGRKYRQHLHSMGVETRSTDCLIYIQVNTDSTLDELIPARHRDDVRNGWTVRFRIDSWVFGNMVGYDACNI